MSFENVEYKFQSGSLDAKNGGAVEQEIRNGQPVGIVSGYIATWKLDRVNDIFEKMAFNESVKDYKDRGQQLPLRDFHGKTVGGFPAESLKIDERGLYGRGEINLVSPEGKALHSLAMQGVLQSLSIGYAVQQAHQDRQGNRRIEKAHVIEGSIVDHPANLDAQILEVKSVGQISVVEIKAMTDRELESLLKKAGFSGAAATRVVACLDFAKLGRDTATTSDLSAEGARALEETKSWLASQEEAELISEIERIKQLW